jgi:hypothetical protein
MVSIWLTKVKGPERTLNMQKSASPSEADVLKGDRFWRGLLPVLLDAGGAQSGEAVLIDGKLPRKELVDGQRVAAAGLLKREQATTDRGNDFGFTANNPPFGPGRRQVRNR